MFSNYLNNIVRRFLWNHYLIPMYYFLFYILLVKLEWLNSFYFSTKHSNVQGIDFYSFPKTYLNLLRDVSLYASWDLPLYKEQLSTIYLAHPLFAFIFGPFFAFLDPTFAYWLFTFITIILLYICARLFLSILNSSCFWSKILIWGATYFSFPVYLLLYVGNIHAFLVLSLSLFFYGWFNLILEEKQNNVNLNSEDKLLNCSQVSFLKNKPKFILTLGLLGSLFTKPFVIIFLPILLVYKRTRSLSFLVIMIYIIISILFLEIDSLNPEKNNYWQSFLQILKDPNVTNVFSQNFQVNKIMRCNSFHWLNLYSSTINTHLHIDIFSLYNLFLKIFNFRLPNIFFKFPIIIIYILAFFAFRIKDEKQKLYALGLVFLNLSITYFLSYKIVWEYQFTSILPILLSLIICLTHPKLRIHFLLPLDLYLLKASIVLCFIINLPTLFFMLGGWYDQPIGLLLIEASKIVPVVLLYLSKLILNIRAIFYFNLKTATDNSRLKFNHNF